jgi:hypothetical protein
MSPDGDKNSQQQLRENEVRDVTNKGLYSCNHWTLLPWYSISKSNQIKYSQAAKIT